MPETGQINATCAICGYTHPAGSLPDICPRCGSYQARREGGEDASEEKTTIWRCKECGYIHYASQPSEFCPVCGFPASQFEPLKKRKTFIS